MKEWAPSVGRTKQPKSDDKFYSDEDEEKEEEASESSGSEDSSGSSSEGSFPSRIIQRGVKTKNIT